MKKTIRIKVCLAAIFTVFLFPPKSYGQLEEMGKILSGGIHDAELLAEAYLSPFTTAFGATLNSGWYNTARPHRFPGFDLTLSVNFAMIPDNAKVFNPAGLGLSSNAILTGPAQSPTIAGSSGAAATSVKYVETVNAQEITLVEYNLPGGTGLGFVPSPTLQLGVGLPLNTDVIVRYIPQTGLSDVGNLGLWGVGIKHSLKQWIPVVNRLPVINLSAMAGYTSFYTTADLKISPSDIGAVDATSNAVSFTDQQLDFRVRSFTANIVASVDIPIITAYAGVGVNNTGAGLRMLGWYPIPEINQATLQAEVNDNSVIRKDPVDVKLRGEGSALTPRFNAGAKLKLTIIHIHADYTWAEYSVLSAGIGISIR